MSSFLTNLEEELILPPKTQSSKLIDLPTAIKKSMKAIEPQMKLHFSCAGALPYSSIREIIRQSNDYEDEFQFVAISLGSASQIQMLVARGLISKLITSYVGDVYPRPGVSPIFQRAVDTGLKIEQWSLMTLCLRLYAGALGLKFIPTKSILGSTMAYDNASSFKIIKDPFDSAEQVAIIKELVPDLSFIHAWIADPFGNAIIFPPYSENLWGCFGSKKVILTAERVVDTQVIRNLANTHQCIAIPNAIVSSVSESPFGGHPGSNYGPIGAGYDIDLNHLIEYRESAKDVEKNASWMKNWILDTTSESYLQKVGFENLTYNSGQLSEEYWKWAVNDKKSMITLDHPSTPIENMIWMATEIIKRKVDEKGYQTILAGQGASNLAAWLGTYSLCKEGSEINLLAEVGLYGYLPKPSSPYIFEFNNLRSSTAIVDSIMALGVFLQNTKSLGVLGAGQIDQHGNINSTRVHSFVLFGSGGANDVGSNAEEIIVLLPLRSGRFPEKVPYITVPGTNVTTCVTTEGIFEKVGDQKFSLTCVLNNDSDENKIITKITKSVEWELKIDKQLKKLSLPSKRWLKFLRSFDPDRHFLGRIKS
ncbi:MAG: CoA-transferase [Candidatus Hermodarchaeota archaeon]